MEVNPLNRQPHGSEAPGKLAEGPNNEMGKEAFLQLLIAQIKHQDPLKPLEDRELVAQLAQFSSLEQAIAGNAKLESLLEQTISNQAANFVGWVDRNVLVEKSDLQRGDNAGGEHIVAEIPQGTQSLRLAVKDENNTLIKELVNGPVSAGMYTFDWDGKDSDGKSVGPGKYQVVSELIGREGDSRTGKLFTRGRVEGALIGEKKLQVDGKYYDLSDIKKIMN